MLRVAGLEAHGILTAHQEEGPILCSSGKSSLNRGFKGTSGGGGSLKETISKDWGQVESVLY